MYKAITQYVIKSLYDKAIGWEITTYCENYEEAKRDLKDYQENQPEYPHRIARVRR